MMSGSTWTWLGATGAWANPANWTLDAGSGNANNYPASGDTALLTGGTIQPPVLAGTELASNTLDLSGGAVVDFTNGSTLDGGSTVNGLAGTVGVSGVFTDLGNISVVGAGNTLTVAIAAGGTLVSDGVFGLDIGLNDGDPGAFNGGTLYVLGGTLANQEVHLNGGYADVTSALESNDEFSIDGGLLEIAQQNTVSPLQITFVNANTSVPSTLKFDAPGLFNGDGAGAIYAFTVGDTIDIGSSAVGTIIYGGVNTSSNIGTLTVENAGGTVVFSAELSGGDASVLGQGTFAVSGTLAGSFQVVQGVGADTLISESTAPPGPSSWGWTGGTAAWNTGADWTLTGGPGNANGYPANGDSAVVPSGTILLNAATLDLASLDPGGTPGGGVVATNSSRLEVDGGLLMLGLSALSVDAGSAVDLGPGGIFANGAVDIESGVSLLGTGLISAAIVNNGELVASNAPSVSASAGGTLEVTGPISGTGSIILGAGTTLRFDGATGSGQSFSFNSGLPETLVLGTPGAAFGNAIAGLADGDRIEFGNGMTITSASVVNGNTIAVDFTANGTAGTYDMTNVGFGANSGKLLTVGTDTATGDTYLQVARSTATEDFSGGGSSDILFQNVNSGLLLDWQLSNGVYAGNQPIAGASSDWQYVGTGDFYGGGTSDILFQNLNSRILLDWQMVNGTYANDSAIAGASYGWNFLGTGDFTGNGTDDILFQNSNSGQVLYWDMQNGQYNGSVSIAGATPDWTYAGIGDFTGNGADDILFRNTGGELLYWHLAGGTYSQAVPLAGATPDWKVVGTGDFYGNGISDILFQNTNSNLLLDWQVVNGAFNQSVLLGAVPTGWKYVGTGDYTGNGTDDILFQNNTSGQLMYWKMSAGSVTQSVALPVATSDWKVLTG